MNVLNKALLRLSFSVYFVPCAFGCCFQRQSKQIARQSVITWLQLSAQFTGKLCDVLSQTDAFLLPTNYYMEEIWRTSSFTCTDQSSYARLKFSRWNQSLCSSLSCGIPSGVYFYIICPSYGPGCFRYTCGQSHRGRSQYRDIGFIFNSSKIFYCYNCSIYIYIYIFFSGPASASTTSATKPHLSSRTSWICSPRALDNPELDSLDEHD